MSVREYDTTWRHRGETRPERMLSHFRYAHLPPKLAAVSAEFHALASAVVRFAPPSAERTVCLRKLLEAKDAGVRAAMEDDARPGGGGSATSITPGVSEPT